MLRSFVFVGVLAPFASAIAIVRTDNLAYNRSVSQMLGMQVLQNRTISQQVPERVASLGLKGKSVKIRHGPATVK
ncbi:MAG: hypothetical protein K0Q73_8722 [Paenibacillus sp.]|jgi:hypothetical protein|nr:hypothetical protein [Paenibacillus sp.]